MAVEPRHNLVDALTSFVGREREVAEVAERLASTRLLTLVGPGGIGKTRLALRVGAGLVARHQGGIWLVELAPLADATTIPRAIASALGVYEDASRPVLATIADALRARGPLLLILDNCEHLVDGVAATVDPLLRDCPDLTVLATSREALGVVGEAVRQVPPLSVPEESAPASSEHGAAAALDAHEATRLFVERARAVSDRLVLAEQHASAVAQICRRLDGIPLAIELAAARARLLTPQQIAARLDDRFRLLTEGGRTALPRHRTLRAAIDWSHDLLTDDERRVLRRLAVFAGGCTLEAAEAVAGAGDATLDLLGRLVDRSMLTVDLAGAEARYDLLETIRAYALERLDASGEAPAIRRRHADYFLDLAERAEPELHGPDQGSWADRLAADHDNLRAALTWTLGAGDAPITALRLAAALGWFWFIRGQPSETRLLEAALAATAEITTDVEVIRSRAKGLCGLAWLGRIWNDPPRAVALGEESLALSRSIGDRPAIAYTLTALGMLLRDLRDYPQARAAAEEGIAIARELGETRTLAHGLYVLAAISWYECYVPVRADRTDEASAPTPSQPLSPGTYADLPRSPSIRQGIELLEESLALFRQLGDKWGAGIVLTGGAGLTTHCLISGDYARAIAACTESLGLHWEVGDLRSIGVVLRNFGHVALSEGEPRRAARLIAAWRRTFETINTGLMPRVWPVPEHEVEALRSRLGDQELATVWEQGRAMSLEQAIAYALRREDPFGDDPPGTHDGPSTSTAPRVRDPAALTPREREVAILVGRGYSNRRIAEALVIAEKTAEVHARNIREKLGLDSRAQIAAWAAQHGLLPGE